MGVFPLWFSWLWCIVWFSAPIICNCLNTLLDFGMIEFYLNVHWFAWTCLPYSLHMFLIFVPSLIILLEQIILSDCKKNESSIISACCVAWSSIMSTFGVQVYDGTWLHLVSEVTMTPPNLPLVAHCGKYENEILPSMNYFAKFIERHSYLLFLGCCICIIMFGLSHCVAAMPFPSAFQWPRIAR
jgi:hypothetical protein